VKRLLRALVFVGLAALSACAIPSPYDGGRSPADLPVQVNVIKLENIVLGNTQASASDVRNPEHLAKLVNSNPNENSREVLSLAKQTIISQFGRFGIRVIEDDSQKPDLLIRVMIHYQPEIWLVGRNMSIRIYVYTTDGSPLLHEDAFYFNSHGLMGATLESRDYVVSSTAREAASEVDEELAKHIQPAVLPSAVSPRPAVLPSLSSTTDSMVARGLIQENGPLLVNLGSSTIALDSVVVKPTGPGPFPIALITHGWVGDAAERAKMTADGLSSQARDLAHRGWLAVGVMRRGYGRSEGTFTEGFDCRSLDYAKFLKNIAGDLTSALAAVSLRPDADPSRVLGVGVFTGGIAMLTFASEHPRGLVGIVNVSGGAGLDAAGKNCDEGRLIAQLAAIGGQVRVPTLWLYAENDGTYGPDLVKRMQAGFTNGGGQADLRAFGPVGSDGHIIWSSFEGRAHWLPEMDKFLTAHNLPTWDPTASNALSARLTPNARKTLTAYLAAGSEKALALAPSGVVAFWAGSTRIQLAREGALKECQKSAAVPCTIAMEDFDAVAQP